MYEKPIICLWRNGKHENLPGHNLITCWHMKTSLVMKHKNVVVIEACLKKKDKEIKGK